MMLAALDAGIAAALVFCVLWIALMGWLGYALSGRSAIGGLLGILFGPLGLILAAIIGLVNRPRAPHYHYHRYPRHRRRYR